MRRAPARSTPGVAVGPRLLIVVGVLFLAGALLLLKVIEPRTESAGQPEIGAATADGSDAGLPATAPAAASALLPEDQLDEYLAAGRPVLAFFHSSTCAQCIKMTEIVEQVYPDYADRVALVDVNVYDRRNEHLLGRAGIQVIPTLILIDRHQQEQGFAGVMPAETLRARLELLAQEP